MEQLFNQRHLAVVGNAQVLKVFEYQTLRIGEQNNGIVFNQQHWQAMSLFLEKQHHPYYHLIHQGVRFSYYVGAIQIGDLTIEILPKADKNPQPDAQLWQGVLLDMLKSCRLLKIETISLAWLQLRSNSILDLYYDLFLHEVEQLLRQGLIKAYHRKEENVTAYKGRLVFQKHIHQNLAHQERFYTNHETYHYDHLLNQVILQGLYILKNVLVTPTLTARLQRILTHFPTMKTFPITEKQFQQISLNRKTARYQTALEIARLLIFNYSPDVQSGQHHLLALLFDMNLLFEEYVYQQLRRLTSAAVVVKRQEIQPFWNRRYIQPDMVLTYKNKKYVLDTKWKILKKVQPDMQDLKQLFIYCQYFDATEGVLLYPKVNDLPDLSPIDYERNQTISCGLHFVNVIGNDGRLNARLGQDILDFLEENK